MSEDQAPQSPVEGQEQTTEDTAVKSEAASPAIDDGRYSLNDEGQILWQKDATNPLPGVVVGHIEKGEALLAPVAKAEGHEGASDWLAIHVRNVLEPLFMLMQVEGEGALVGAPRDIATQLYEHLGVMHRSDLQELIGQLDADMRRALRSKGVRLGPVLVFMPALVKPAAVRLRALLWGVWHGKTLPVSTPADGRVSEVIDPQNIDRTLYRMIGYPVFGPRAVRIDMLDRVVSDIYDAADKGVFEAKHKYAEWFGCGLDDLYAMLEAMGHRKLKVEAPATEAEAESADAPVAQEPKAEEASQEVEAAPVAEETPVAEAAPVAEVAEVGVEDVAKPAPVLVKFVLKRGKMSDRPAHRRPHGKHYKSKASSDGAPDEGQGKKGFTPRKAYDPNRPAQDGKKDFKRKGKGDHRKSKRDAERGNGQGRVYTFEGKKDSGADDANNPFAILKNLK